MAWTWGDGVRAFRGIRQLTVEEFSDKAATTPEEIARIEAGARDVDYVTAVKIARAPNVDPAALFWLEDWRHSRDAPVRVHEATPAGQPAGRRFCVDESDINVISLFRYSKEGSHR